MESCQTLFWIQRNGTLATTSGSSSAVERQLPKLDVAGSIPASRSKPQCSSLNSSPSIKKSRDWPACGLIFICARGRYLPAALADEAADMECIWTKPIPKPPTAPAINPITISKGTLSRNDFFFDFAIQYSPCLKLEITTLWILAFVLPFAAYGGTVTAYGRGTSRTILHSRSAKCIILHLIGRSPNRGTPDYVGDAIVSSILRGPASTKGRFPPYHKSYFTGALMTEPSYEELKARLADLEKQVETKKKSGAMEFRVSEKGGVSVYGLGRFPVTLYYEQWTKLLNAVPDLKAFIEENKSKLKLKES